MKYHLEVHQIFRSVIKTFSPPIVILTSTTLMNTTFVVNSIVDYSMYTGCGEMDIIMALCSLRSVLIHAIILFQVVSACLNLPTEVII